jgi:hypothetical protein
MSFKKFSHMFHDLYSTLLSQLNSDTETILPDELEEFSQMDTSTDERNT